MSVRLVRNIFLVGLVFFFVGCGSSSTPETKVTLKEWVGEWRSVNDALKEKGLDSFYEEIAQANPTYSAGGIKAGFSRNIVGSSFKSILIDEEGITFPIFNRKTKKYETKKVAYEFVGKKEESNKTMYQFKSKSEDKSVASVKFISMMVPHGKDFKHYHLLNSSKGFDKIKFSLKGRKPIFVEKDVTNTQLVEFFKARVEKIKKMFDPSLSSWKGEWVSVAKYINDDSASIDEVYAKLIKEFAGKKKGGGNFTKEEVKGIFRTFLEKDLDAHEIKIDQNNITFIKEADTQTHEYILDGTVSAGGHGSWITFTTNDPLATKFKNLLLSVVHGNPLEFHGKGGTADYKALSQAPGVPTFFIKTTSDEDFAKELEIFGRIALKMATATKK